MEKITIGRDNSCDIVINDKRVSRIHAEIIYDPSGTECVYYSFCDMSSNGTIVNGQFINGRCIDVWRKFHRFNNDLIEPQIFLAKVIKLPWTKVLNAFSRKFPKYFYENEVTTEKSPENLNSWNWGAFFFGWIWAISNGIYWPLIEIIPFIGWTAAIVVRIILGANGNQWAWEKMKWNNIEHFKKVQHSWTVWGIILFALSIIPLILYFTMIFALFF